MSLTIPQKKYLVTRIDEVANQKASELKDPEARKNREVCQEGIKAGICSSVVNGLLQS